MLSSLTASRVNCSDSSSRLPTSSAGHLHVSFSSQNGSRAPSATYRGFAGRRTCKLRIAEHPYSQCCPDRTFIATEDCVQRVARKDDRVAPRPHPRDSCTPLVSASDTTSPERVAKQTSLSLQLRRQFSSVPALALPTRRVHSFLLNHQGSANRA